MKEAIIAALLMISAAASVGQSAKPLSYVSARFPRLGFELDYPANYHVKDLSHDEARRDATDRQQSLLYVRDVNAGNDEDEAAIEIILDRRPFNMDTIRSRYSPTGLEDWSPAPARFGGNRFYYYGAGGGGVNYPDQFFYNLHGQILRITFDGPYDADKSPDNEAQEIDRKSV